MRSAQQHLRGFCRGVVLRCLLISVGIVSSARAQTLHLEIAPAWGKIPLIIGQAVGEQKISITRLDGLLSQLGLQRSDGSWQESKDWRAYFSLEGSRLVAFADGLPPQRFKAIRFRVGLNAETDRTAAQSWPPDHPLHPDVCGLHWGWSSGYVFLAIEGRSEEAKGKSSGFSYHLAGAAEPMFVELPVDFSGERATTIRLSLDVGSILDAGNILARSSSTHSRDGDALAIDLKKRVAAAFRVSRVSADSYQSLPRQRPGPGTQLLGTPYQLEISERLPKVTLPADNPLTREGVALGQRLFHEAQLSKGNVQSCASCHDPMKGFTDGQPLSSGAGGQLGRRNAMPLSNLAWDREMFWDGRAKSLREQVLVPIQDAREMNESLDRVLEKLAADARYVAQFKAAFGSGKITTERLALALEQYLLTLVSQDSRFDLAARKLARLTEQEQRGLKLFVTEHDPARGLRGADCFHCHGGNLFTNHRFMNNGLEPRPGDLGRMEVTRLESDRGKFKVPTLRNVALTAPYMHDGRFATLEEVVDHYNGRLHRSLTLDPNLAKHPEAGLGLSAEDKSALVAFLKSLTDERLSSPDTLQSQQFTKLP